MSWEAGRVALENKVNQALGTDPANPVTRAASEMAGVGARYVDSVKGLAAPVPGWTKMGAGQKAVAVVRRTQQVLGTAMGAMGVMQDMVDVGFANLTAPIAAVFPSFPAATLGMLYVGIPHAHKHPPSFVAPVPPLPLPSLGPITLGTCVRVLIGCLPAARSGDLGVAPTCGGFSPFFQIYTGSSNVFIGGARAARMLDICKVCGKGEGRKPSAMAVAMATLGMAADIGEAAVESDPAMMAAKSLAGAMAGAQMAADAVAIALSKTMGLDACNPPIIGPPGIGAVTLGWPTVLIGGFPMPNLPNPAGPILNALKRLAGRARCRLFGSGKPG